MLKTHWRTRHQDAKGWKDLVFVVARRPSEKVVEKRRVDILILRKAKRLQDPGNREGSVKHLVDALVHHGWLVDDSNKWMTLNVTEHYSRTPGTVVFYGLPNEFTAQKEEPCPEMKSLLGSLNVFDASFATTRSGKKSKKPSND